MILSVAGPEVARASGIIVTVASLAIVAAWAWYLFRRADRVPGGRG